MIRSTVSVLLVVSIAVAVIAGCGGGPMNSGGGPSPTMSTMPGGPINSGGGPSNMPGGGPPNDAGK